MRGKARQLLLLRRVAQHLTPCPSASGMCLVEGRTFPSRQFHFSTKDPHENPPPAQEKCHPAVGGPTVAPLQDMLCPVPTSEVDSHTQSTLPGGRCVGSHPRTGRVASGPRSRARLGG